MLHPYKASVGVNPPIPPVDGMDIDKGPPSAEIKRVVLDGIVISMSLDYFYLQKCVHRKLNSHIFDIPTPYLNKI